MKVTFRELRLLLRRGADVRRLCKLVFSNQDASIYIIPYGPSNRYAVGVGAIGAHQDSVKYDAEGAELERVPKLSIHQSGQVHANAGAHRVGPISIPPLEAWRGAHIATILAETFHGLSRQVTPLRRSGATWDFPIDVAAEVDSGAVAIYLNGLRPSFDAAPVITLSVTRSTLALPLHIGIRPRSQEQLGDAENTGGVIAISGWTPGQPKSTQAKFLVIRGT